MPGSIAIGHPARQGRSGAAPRRAHVPHSRNRNATSADRDSQSRNYHVMRFIFSRMPKSRLPAVTHQARVIRLAGAPFPPQVRRTRPHFQHREISSHGKRIPGAIDRIPAEDARVGIGAHAESSGRRRSDTGRRDQGAGCTRRFHSWHQLLGLGPSHHDQPLHQRCAQSARIHRYGYGTGSSRCRRRTRTGPHCGNLAGRSIVCRPISARRCS